MRPIVAVFSPASNARLNVSAVVCRIVFFVAEQENLRGKVGNQRKQVWSNSSMETTNPSIVIHPGALEVAPPHPGHWTHAKLSIRPDIFERKNRLSNGGGRPSGYP